MCPTDLPEPQPDAEDDWMRSVTFALLLAAIMVIIAHLFSGRVIVQ